MSVYVPLARKYRPRKFSDVIGQDVVVKILTQAIANNRLSSAILLNGTRGIGKTTIARILARTIRCDARGVEPCEKCAACVSDESSMMDIIEMDAASNTGVDDIREIIDSCKYLPSNGRYKVFIIDEVHMLSKSAFNALLKTLEEPPAHVKFIFATTELYKIPETVLSRCLRFDLKKIDQRMLEQFLASVCTKEKIQFEESALRLVAKAANGSIRDSLSILEQAINVSDGKIVEQNILGMLNSVTYSDAFQILKLILSNNPKEAISLTRRIVLSGAAASEVVRAIMSIVHKMTCIHVSANYFGDCSLSHDEEIGLSLLAKENAISKLSTLWQMLERGLLEISGSECEDISLEMLIIRLCYASDLPDLSQIIKMYESNQIKHDHNNKTSLVDEALKMFGGTVS